ncbi:hypothetical protein EI77_04519 [Prosthecobacter fusiformis]|uniref:DUF6036 domain-containing protein n=1 Tax=Prosthecobacter fusiformis TaxID=48464 RepID=A0A4R7RID2_9BACT|nr:DUF6036 family nucleotidyltransferase [Prosthecobacter fusiformis]TDU63097.1 hypothetical protein EI77_04519 [Prosthecobacter fusiformis]
MHNLHPELTEALGEMLDRLDSILRRGGYEGEPVQMYLAGGMAVHYYCGSRYTDDVDATFSKRLLLPYDQLAVSYMRQDNTASSIYLDPTYNDTFALLHPDHRELSVEWENIGNEHRLIHLRVFSALDLAVSKIARFSPSDQSDILALASRRLFNSEQLQEHADEALGYYVGDTRWIHLNLIQICQDIDLALSA